MFAVLAALELVEHALGERLEALGAHEAARVPQLSGGVDDLLGRVEAQLAPLAHGLPQRHRLSVGGAATAERQ